MRVRICVTVALLLTMGHSALAQQLPLIAQDRDNAPARLLTGAERASLGDPLFNLVLRDHPDAITLDALESHLRPRESQLFVVDENIANPAVGQSRRAVITYTGTTDGEILDSNIMLSLFFDSSSIAQGVVNIEALGWDAHRGRYNYYKLDMTGTPQPQPIWKFRGSSDGADLLDASERQGTCMACHITGSPIMKELPLPWNNWHSFRSGGTTNHLQRGNPESWPVASDAKLQRLEGAERLETNFIIPAVTQFSHRRVLTTLRRSEITGDVDVDAQGRATLIEARRILRHLFQTTEFNIASSDAASGFHPFDGVADAGPATDVVVPGAFFLDRHLLTGGGIRGYRGLGINEPPRLRPSRRYVLTNTATSFASPASDWGGRKATLISRGSLRSRVTWTVPSSTA